MTQQPHLSPASLLAHEPFVRAVVRDLLRDEQRVQDVLQETWIRALAKGPRESGSLKSWLASVARRLALDERRGDARRERRERETARGEALESVDALHSRLEAQRQVVDAVLALEEPYKSVVLLAYYEQLAPEAIGERLGRSAATVRSQLSRAHEILKRRLDAQHGGDRSAWAGVLLPWAVATKSKAGVLVAAGIGLTLLGAGAWVLPRLSTERVVEPAPIAMEIQAQQAVESSELSAAAPTSRRESVPVLVDSQSNATAMKPDLSKLEADPLRDLAVQAMRTLERKLLTPAPSLFEQEHGLLALPDTGLTKLVMRTQNGFAYDGLVFPRFGGAYFSFATLSHDYDREPDLGFEQGRLQSGFYGAMVGMVLPIGDTPLEGQAPTAAQMAVTLPAARRSAWELVFASPETDDIPGARKLQRQVSELRLSSAPARIGVSYLVRTWSPGEHDQLVGVRVLEIDTESVTIAWRVLQRFTHAGEQDPKRVKPDYSDVPPAPAWVEALGVKQLVELVHELRKLAEPVLLEVPAALRRDNDWRLAGGLVSGWFRLLPEDRYVPVIEASGGGAYYSFEQRGHTSSNWEIAASGDRLATPMLLDLGVLTRAEYERAAGGIPPPDLSGEGAQSWQILWNARSQFRGSDGVSDRRLAPEDEQHLRLPQGPKPAANHVYLLRSIGREDGSDHLLLLTVLEAPKNGTSFCWRELKRFDR